jgi:hypothetical protein
MIVFVYNHGYHGLVLKERFEAPSGFNLIRYAKLQSFSENKCEIKVRTWDKEYIKRLETNQSRNPNKFKIIY